MELAWRLDSCGRYGPARRWLVVTGTNGKTTTTSMLHAMLTTAGLNARLCGNIGNPLLDALAEPPTCWPWNCPVSSCTGRRRCDLRPASC
ncbi:mur ligase middle domain protein [Mycobacterium xenopi 3993]|nr:mur ligase middle domain protein [Mycobacterium xenopi 3993]